MPPKFKGEVPLRLSDGRAFTLTFNHETLFGAEMAYGHPLHFLLAHLQANMWGAVRAFLFAALQPKHPEITLKDCSDMLLGGAIDDIAKSISAGLDAAMPDSEGKEGANPPPSPRRGKTSGGSGARRGSSRSPSGKQRPARSR